MSENAQFTVAGVRLVATTAGALYWPAENALIVSDLHLEKGSSYARRGVLLPPYDTRTTLRRLTVLRRRFEPSLIISLGDAFHDRAAEARMDAEDARLLDRLMDGLRWVWITGNHDPLPPARFAGEAHDELSLGGLVFRHEPASAPPAGNVEGELSGHLHPCARVRADARLIRRRCFLTDGSRAILPAFGAYAGGLNVLDPAYAGLFGAFTAWVLGGRGVYPFSADKLAPDAGGGLEANRLDAPGFQSRLDKRARGS